MLVGPPRLVVPTQVAAEVREQSVDLVVGLVPALLLRHRHPAGDLATLGRDPRQAVVEHARDAVLDRVRSPAAAAAQAVAILVEPPRGRPGSA